MRPAPKPRHVPAVLIFTAVAIVSAYLAVDDPRLAPGQINIATAAMKRADPELYPADFVYGVQPVWRYSPPVLYGPMEMVLVPTNYRDLALPFRVSVGLLVLVYLCGMYALLHRQCHSWSNAAFVAVMSVAIVPVLNGWFWGVGSLASVTPGVFCQAVLPLIMLAFLRFGNCFRAMLLVFVLAGALANVHLFVSLNIVLVLLAVYLGMQRFHPRAWPRAILLAAASVTAALPYTLYYLVLRGQIAAPGVEVTYATARETLRLTWPGALFPELPVGMLAWLPWGLLLLVPAALVLLRVERFRVRDLNAWVYFMVAAAAVALGLQGLSQLVGIWMDAPPPILDFAQASALVMLALYVLLAQALTQVFRIVRSHRNVIRWVCGIVLVIWILPSDNFRPARHHSYEWMARWTEPAVRPVRLQELQRQQAQRGELSAIANWARENAALDAVFLVRDIQFRMASGRAILAADDDIRYIYYAAPGRLGLWADLLRRQNALLHPATGRADLPAIQAFVGQLSTQPALTDVSEWYVILDAHLVGTDASLVGAYRAEEVPPQDWGREKRVFRIRPPTR